jgi:hypothetical protein
VVLSAGLYPVSRITHQNTEIVMNEAPKPLDEADAILLRLAREGYPVQELERLTEEELEQRSES